MTSLLLMELHAITKSAIYKGVKLFTQSTCLSARYGVVDNYDSGGSSQAGDLRNIPFNTPKIFSDCYLFRGGHQKPSEIPFFSGA